MKYLMVLAIVFNFLGCGDNSSIESNLEDDNNSTFVYKGKNTKDKVEGVLLYRYSNIVPARVSSNSPKIFSSQESFDLLLDDLNTSYAAELIPHLKYINIDFKKENLLLFSLKDSGCGIDKIIIDEDINNIIITSKRRETANGKCNAMMIDYDIVCLVSKEINFIINGSFQVDNL